LLSAPSRKVGFTDVGVATAEAGLLTYHLNLGGGVVESPKRGVGTVGSLLWAIAGELPLGKNGLSAVVEFRGESVRRSLPDNTALGGLVWKRAPADTTARYRILSALKMGGTEPVWFL